MRTRGRCLPEVAARVDEPAASGRAGRRRRASQFLADERVLAAEQLHRQPVGMEASFDLSYTEL